jgi:hypothetical protein
LPFTKSLSFDLDQNVTDKALDGLFSMLAKEEKMIRPGHRPAQEGVRRAIILPQSKGLKDTTLVGRWSRDRKGKKSLVDEGLIERFSL